MVNTTDRITLRQIYTHQSINQSIARLPLGKTVQGRPKNALPAGSSQAVGMEEPDNFPKKSKVFYEPVKDHKDWGKTHFSLCFFCRFIFLANSTATTTKASSSAATKKNAIPNVLALHFIKIFAAFIDISNVFAQNRRIKFPKNLNFTFPWWCVLRVRRVGKQNNCNPRLTTCKCTCSLRRTIDRLIDQPFDQSKCATTVFLWKIFSQSFLSDIIRSQI